MAIEDTEGIRRDLAEINTFVRERLDPVTQKVSLLSEETERLKRDISEIQRRDRASRRDAVIRQADVDADLAQITAAMSKHGVRRVLVTRDSEIAGVVTLDDVIDAMAQIMNNLSGMLTRQLDYELAHMVSQDNAA